MKYRQDDIKILVDANNLCHIAYYSTGDLSLKEIPTGVIFGFMQQLLSVLKKFGNNITFCWDSKKSHRKRIYPEYKGNRKKNKTELDLTKLTKAYEQFDLIRTEIIPSLGFVNNFRQTGFEADDLIAYLCNRHKSDKKIIVSSDKDLYQLLYRNEYNLFTMIYDTRKKETFTKEMFEKKYGIKPSQWAEAKAIFGDSSDNIKGVKGVGEITAIRYLKGNLKENANVFKKIQNSKDIIERNLKLVKLPFDKKIQLSGVYTNKFNRVKLFNIFNKYGFDSFLTKYSFNEWLSVLGVKNIKKLKGKF